MSEHEGAVAVAQGVVDAFRDVQDEPGDDFVVTLSQEQAAFIGRAMAAYVRPPSPIGPSPEAIHAAAVQRSLLSTHLSDPASEPMDPEEYERVVLVAAYAIDGLPAAKVDDTLPEQAA